MAKFIPVAPFNLVIFGGTGDLARRKLLPALLHRWKDGQIPPSSRIVGAARTRMGCADYVAFALNACKQANDGPWDSTAWDGFSTLLRYWTFDATQTNTDWDSLKDIIDPDLDVSVFYLATSQHLYVRIAEILSHIAPAGGRSRLVLEKPIGTDLASARDINKGVCQYFPEGQIYRIDHYLGKETVQNLMVLRFANRLLEPLWNRTAIDHVQITAAENIGIEGRGDYYDRSGALRDMVQNHLLQLLCLIAMEPPGTMDEDDIRTEKIKVLKALTRLTPDRARASTVRGQYRAGKIENTPSCGYLEEIGKNSTTETFVAIEAEIANWRWAGVPFYLRTGKRMASRHSDIVVQFKPVPHAIFGTASGDVNRLVIRLQPDESVRLFIQIKEPGPGGLRITSLPLNLSYADNFAVRYPDAYERLLMDIVRGNLALFMRRDEVEAAWAWVDDLIAAWAHNGTAPELYPAGQNGPSSSAMLLARNGRQWWDG